MKKILTGILLTLSIIGITTSQINAYEISSKKENVIKTSLSPSIVSKIESIISKWDDNKTYAVYKKIKKIVLKLQVKTLERKDISMDEKIKLINKYNSVMYIIEKKVSDDYKPENNKNDSI